MNREKIARLEALLDRIQRNQVAPRTTHPGIMHVEPTPAPPVVVAAEPEIDEPPPETVGNRVPEYKVPEPIEEPAVEERPSEPVLEAISGEFAVADVPMELEELGPADEVNDEDLVEIHVEEPAPKLEVVADYSREPPVEEERISEPPESGRELVVAPHESARMAVAAPATPDPIGLELHEKREQEDEPPPESARNLRAAPAVPQTSDVFDLEPTIPKIEPIMAPPIDPREHVDVVRPVIVPADVAAFTSAARAPRPETFGTLLDAALDL